MPKNNQKKSFFSLKQKFLDIYKIHVNSLKSYQNRTLIKRHYFENKTTNMLSTAKNITLFPVLELGQYRLH